MIEVVRDRMRPDQAAQVLAFWAAHGGPTGDAARAHLRDVVTVLTDGGHVLGSSSAVPAAVAAVGNRRFYVHDCVVAGDPAAELELARATHAVLDEEYEPRGDGPVGLCLLLDGSAWVRARPELQWEGEVRFTYAGRLADGRQVRVGYFDVARIGERAPMPWGDAWPAEPEMPPGYEIAVYADQQRHGAGDAVAFWVSEGLLAEDEARRRAGELLVVATDPDGRLAGIVTTYLARSERLGFDAWHYRVSVAAAHRRLAVSVQMHHRARDHLAERWASGADRRARAMVFEVQNPGLKLMDYADWYWLDCTYIGDNERGDHYRVYYFPGATLP